jgi:hypothetical protein
MAEVANQAHQRVLNNLEAAQRAVAIARDSTEIPDGYQNFELAMTTLAECREAIERMRDHEQISVMLRRSSGVLGLWEAGPAEPAVTAARQALSELVTDLTP